MRVPRFDSSSIWLQGLGLFLIGTVTGAVAMMLAHQLNFSLIMSDNVRLMDENRKLKEDLESAEKLSLRRTVVAKIDVRVETREDTALDQLVRDELRKLVEAELKLFRGKSVSLLADPEYGQILEHLIRRVYTIGRTQYLVEMRTIAVLHNELRVWVSARPHVGAEPGREAGR